MPETLYATFSDPNRARKAVADLVALGVKQEEISLLVSQHERVRDATNGVSLEDTRTTAPMHGAEFMTTNDPMGNNMRQSSVSRMENGVDTEFDSAQMKLSTNDAASRGFNALSDDSPEGIIVDPDADAYRDADPHLKSDANVQDFAHGAAKGAGIGLGFGAAAALASLLIPGLGLIVGGGTLAVAAAALATGAGAGAIAGGITGILKQQGLPDEYVGRYVSVYDGGGAILAVTVTNPELRDSIEQTLQADGAQELETHQAYLS